MARNFCELKALCEVCRPWQDEMQRESNRRTCLLTSPSRRSRSRWQPVRQLFLSPRNEAICGVSSSSRTSARCRSGDAPCTYDACCWGGARKKKQALESNVPEIQALHSSCHHVHSKSDWTPYRGTGGTMIYPSSGGAEYTADLAFAIRSGCPGLVGSSQRRQGQVARPTCPYSAGGR